MDLILEVKLNKGGRPKKDNDKIDKFIEQIENNFKLKTVNDEKNQKERESNTNILEGGIS